MRQKRGRESVWGRGALQSLAEIAVAHYHTQAHTHTRHDRDGDEAIMKPRSRALVWATKRENPGSKPGRGEQEGSEGVKTFRLGVRADKHVMFGETLRLRNRFPESDKNTHTHTHTHRFLSPACNCGWRRVETGRKSNLNFLPQSDPTPTTPHLSATHTHTHIVPYR